MKTESDQVVFITNLSERDDLVQKKEKHIRARRLAYFLQMEPPDLKSSDKEIKYPIKTPIQYQRMIEEKWEREEVEVFYRNKTDELKNKLDSFHDLSPTKSERKRKRK